MHIHRHVALFATAFLLAAPTPGAAQSSSSERDRARERAQAKVEKEQERQRERDERDRAASLDTTVTFDAHGTLTVSCPGGAVIVDGAARGELRVHARVDNGGIRFTSGSGRATLEPASGRGCSDGHFEVTVPVGITVVATTWSGSVSVHGVRGPLEVHSQSGDVDVRDVGPRLDVESLSGDVTINGVAGESRIHTVSGSVTLSGARGDLDMETVSGDLDLRDIIARQIRAHTTSGEIGFAGQMLDAGRYEFVSHSGEITLNLPGDTGAELTVSTFNGGIDSDFPITLKAGQHGIGAEQAKRLNFTVGKGGARITAETFSGDINLKRRH